jgi:ribonuclease-3
LKYVLNDIENKAFYIDSKSSLQELAQAEFKQPVRYEVIGERGPEHNKEFVIAAYIGDKRMAEGKGNSKKAASKDAAYKTLLMLKADGKA